MKNREKRVNSSISGTQCNDCRVFSVGLPALSGSINKTGMGSLGTVKSVTQGGNVQEKAMNGIVGSIYWISLIPSSNVLAVQLLRKRRSEHQEEKLTKYFFRCLTEFPSNSGAARVGNN